MVRFLIFLFAKIGKQFDEMSWTQFFLMFAATGGILMVLMASQLYFVHINVQVALQ